MANPSSLDIEVMIAAENDPSRRATLVVLNSMNNILVELKDDFTAHRSDYLARTRATDALANKGRGASYILGWVLGLVQILGAYMITTIKADIKETSMLVSQNVTQDQVQEARLQSVEHLLTPTIVNTDER